MVHQLGLDRVALHVEEAVAAEVRQGVVDGQAARALDSQRHEDLLRAAVGDGVAEAAQRRAGAVHHARAFGEVLQGFQRGLVRLGGHGLVVLDQEPPVVLLGKDLAAVAGPEDIPVVAVGGVQVFGGGEAGEVADALGKIEHLVDQTDVPVRVVFEDEDRCEVVLNDPDQSIG